MAFAAPFVAAFLAVRNRLRVAARHPVGIGIAAAGLAITLGVWGYMAKAGPYTGPMVEPSEDYRAQVFHVTDCPQDPVGDRFVGVDLLLTTMGREGLKLHNSATESAWAGPDGIIAPDDVVLVKINYQWDERGGTILRGLVDNEIARLLEQLDRSGHAVDPDDAP